MPSTLTSTYTPPLGPVSALPKGPHVDMPLYYPQPTQPQPQSGVLKDTKGYLRKAVVLSGRGMEKITITAFNIFKTVMDAFGKLASTTDGLYQSFGLAICIGKSAEYIHQGINSGYTNTLNHLGIFRELCDFTWLAEDVNYFLNGSWTKDIKAGESLKINWKVTDLIADFFGVCQGIKDLGWLGFDKISTTLGRLPVFGALGLGAVGVAQLAVGFAAFSSAFQAVDAAIKISEGKDKTRALIQLAKGVAKTAVRVLTLTAVTNPVVVLTLATTAATISVTHVLYRTYRPEEKAAVVA